MIIIIITTTLLPSVEILKNPGNRGYCAKKVGAEDFCRKGTL